jgi:proline iminopeptidase
MKKILLLFVGLLVLLLALLLWPRSYKVKPMSNRPSTRFWNLPTGSKIAYTMVPAKGVKKPFPLIYLHGGPGAGVTDLEIKILSSLADDGYDVYLYDQAGCGQSARLQDITQYTAERHKRDFEEIVKQLPAEKVILIAQSWGSILSLLFLANNPQKVEKLIVTAPGIIQPSYDQFAEIPAPDSLRLRKPYVSRRATLISKNLRARAAIYLIKNYGWKLMPDEEADKLQTYLVNELNREMVCDTANAVKAESTEGFYAHYMTLKSEANIKDPRPALRNSLVPVYLMKGECDNQKWGFTAEYLQLFPNHKLKVINGAGHNIFIEKPAAYLETIREYLNN